MVYSVDMDMKPTAVIDNPSGSSNTAHCLLQFLHFLIGELGRYHLYLMIVCSSSKVSPLFLLRPYATVRHQLPFLALLVFHRIGVIGTAGILACRSK